MYGLEFSVTWKMSCFAGLYFPFLYMDCTSHREVEKNFGNGRIFSGEFWVSRITQVSSVIPTLQY